MKTDRSKPNIALARRIQKQIRKEPKQFTMYGWFTTDTGRKIPNCGTAACIGGWALSLAWKKNPSIARYDERILAMWEQELAANELRITKEQSLKLFHRNNWPSRIQRMAEWKGAIKMLDLLIEGKL